MAIGRVFENGDKITAKAVHVTSLAECTRRFGRQNKTKMINGKVLSIFTKKTATGRNSRYVRGQFDLGGGVLKVADINVRSIKLVEVATETPEEPAGSSGNEQVSPDPIVQEAQVCASDDGSTSQVPTVDADSMPVTTETQDQMEVVGTPNAPEAREEQLPNDAIPTEAVETEPPPDEIAAARSPSESMDGEEGASSVPGTTTTTVTTRHSQRIENNERAGIVATAHECEWHKYENKDDIPINGKVAKKKWGIRLHSGDILYESGDVQNRYSPLDYFLMSFPMEQSQLCLRETNINLRNNRKRETHFFGTELSLNV